MSMVPAIETGISAVSALLGNMRSRAIENWPVDDLRDHIATVKTSKFRNLPHHAISSCFHSTPSEHTVLRLPSSSPGKALYALSPPSHTLRCG